MITREKWNAMSDEERRKDLASKQARQKHDCTVGVCVTPGPSTKDIPRFLFLVRDMLTMTAVSKTIKNQLKDTDPEFNENSAIFLFLGDTQGAPTMSSTMGTLHAEHASADGFLHVTYMKENVYG